MKDILLIADLGLRNEDDFPAMLFLFHRGVTRTFAGFEVDVSFLAGVDGEDGGLPSLVDGEDGRGGRHHSDPRATCPAAPCPSSWAWWSGPCTCCSSSVMSTIPPICPGFLSR